MGNVVAIRGKVDKTVIGRVASALHVALLARNISLNSYNVGLNLLARMQEAQQYTVNLSMLELTGEIVKLGKRIVGGVAAGSFQDFIQTMQELHDSVWIHSDIRISELDREDVHQRHFSCAPGITAWDDFDPKTPIWFRFDPENLDEMCEEIDGLNESFTEFTKGKVRILEI